jgi:hypothetical protein
LVLGLVAVLLAIVAIVGVVVHAYSHLQVASEARGVAPHLQTGLWSIGKLVLYMLQHQWLSVATELLKSMHWRIEGLVTIRNASLVPLFVPAMRHQMFVKQQPIGGWISTGGF